ISASLLLSVREVGRDRATDRFARSGEREPKKWAWAQAAASGAVWVAIQATQRAQLDDEPGVKDPSKRAPAAPVAAGTFPGTPSRVRAARVPKVRALRASAGTPWRSVRSSGTPASCCSRRCQSRPLRTPPPLRSTRTGERSVGRKRRRAVVLHWATKCVAVQ